MQRFDLYRPIHKAIRTLLFETTQLCARCDFGHAGDGARAAAAVRRLADFLHEHAAHEDAVIAPELERLSPELAADLRNDHARIAGLEAELVALSERLGGATDSERVSLGRRIQDRLGRLVAEHLAHLEREECQVNRILWAHLDDGRLRELEERIVASIPPARTAEWLAVLLPAVSRPECAAILGGVAQAVPPVAFAELTASARVALGPERWSTALASMPVALSSGALSSAGERRP